MIQHSHSGSWFDIIANAVIWSLAAFNKLIAGGIVYLVSLVFNHKMTIDLSKLYFDLQLVAIGLAIFVSFCTAVKYAYNFIMWIQKRKPRKFSKKVRK